MREISLFHSKRLHISVSHLQYNKLLHAVADPRLSLASRVSWQNCHLLSWVIVASSQKCIICTSFKANRYSRAPERIQGWALTVTSKTWQVSYGVIFRSLLLSLSGQIYNKVCNINRPGEYPGFFLSKWEQLRKKTMCKGYWIPGLCLVRAEQFICCIYSVLRFFISNVLQAWSL